jgi:endonuclease G
MRPSRELRQLAHFVIKLQLCLGSWTLSPALRATGDELIVVASGASVRHAANRAAEAVQVLEPGTRLTIMPPHRQGEYLHIRLDDGTEGWIHRSLVQPIVSSAPIDDATPASGAVRDLRAEEREVVTEHLALGRPVFAYERPREGFVLAVNAQTRVPAWVQYELDVESLDGLGDRDLSRFLADESLPRIARAQLADYHSSGFDRGHMAPAGDMKRSQQVMDSSFLLSNIAPQVGPGFNRHIWRFLEEAVRDWVAVRGKLTIVTGPVFQPDNDGVVSYLTIGENHVAVPNAYFKIIVDKDTSEALAFIIPNRQLFGRRFEEFLVSVDEIESVTGTDFFSELPDEVENRLEATGASELWPIQRALRLQLDEATRDVSIEMVDFDERGHVARPNQLENVIRQARQVRPTHMFLMAHGWNNSRSTAMGSYQAMLSLMSEVADENPGTRPDPYRPFVIGVYWPSKAWDEQSGRLQSPLDDEDLTLALLKVMQPADSPATHLQDVIMMRELLQKKPEAVTAGDFQLAWQILRRYTSEAATTEEESLFDDPRGIDQLRQRGLSGSSIGNLFRVFTFWQMKKRAGMIGRSGGQQLLARLMAEFEEAEFHLAGHSFGSKFWLSALADDFQRPIRNVDSLMLLQAAISSYAFADRIPHVGRPGGYRTVLSRVNGPIVATYTSRDWPLSWAYPLGSRLAGQVGELERAISPDRFSALGAVGAAAVGRRIPLRAVGEAYQLAPELWSIDGGDTITGHSGFYNAEVAWLLWSAIRSSDKLQSDHY